jgi:hypothetical protein
MSSVYLDPKIWGPHYWFFLHTVTMTYPHYPNSITKKKYYEFIHNLPLFLPVENISREFSKLLDKYPVTPYLDNRKSFIKWMHFMHNKINEKLEKPQISLNTFLNDYYNKYKTNSEKMIQYYKTLNKIIYFIILFALIIIIYYLYNK